MCFHGSVGQRLSSHENVIFHVPTVTYPQIVYVRGLQSYRLAVMFLEAGCVADIDRA